MSTPLQFEKFLVNGVANTANPLQVTMDKDITVQAVYSDMATVNITGSVTLQAAAGELITIVITKPDTTKVTLTATTLADKTYSTQWTAPAGSYSLIASVPADALYNAVSTPVTPFTINLLARGITVNITPV
jgi:hypothetical protein